MSLERTEAGRGIVHDGRIKTIMKLEDLTTLDQLVEFLAGTQAVAFSVISDKDTCYRWIQGERVKFRYLKCSRQEKGVVIRYLMKISGDCPRAPSRRLRLLTLSRQQLTRLIAQYRKTGRLRRRPRTVSGFKQKHTEQDTRLLAAMDKVNGSEGGREGALGYERHDTPCGPAVKKLWSGPVRSLGRRSTRLTSISVSHLYNLRKSTAYVRQRCHFEKTQPKPSKIGERRKPQPNGQPGYILIDTVHQGDLDRQQKGVYHINAVD